MPVSNDPLAILDRLSKGDISETDLDLLRQHLSASDDKTIKVWSLNAPKPHLTLPKQNDDVMCVAIAPDNQTLISGDKEGTVQIWNLHTGEIVKTQ